MRVFIFLLDGLCVGHVTVRWVVVAVPVLLILNSQSHFSRVRIVLRIFLSEAFDNLKIFHHLEVSCVWSEVWIDSEFVWIAERSDAIIRSFAVKSSEPTCCGLIMAF